MPNRVPQGHIHNYARQLQRQMCGACDKEAVVVAVQGLYETLGQGQPELVWCDSPTQFTNLPQLHGVLALSADKVNAAWQADLVKNFKRSSKELKVVGASKFWSEIDEYCKRAPSEQTRRGSLLCSGITVLLMKILMPRLSEQAEVTLGADQKQLVERSFNAEFSRPSVETLKSLYEQFGARSYLRDLYYEPAIVAPPGKTWVNDEAVERSVSLRPHNIFHGVAWGIWDVLPVMMFDCLRAACTDQPPFGNTEDALLNTWVQLFKNACAYIFFENVCYVCPYPLHQSVDDFGRWHSIVGPAIEFSDGQKMYFWHGTPIEKGLVARKNLITPLLIDLQPNLEKRRVMMEIYGLDKYLRNSGAKKIHEDEYGRLFRKRALIEREPVVAVEVTNSTPEPDGTYKRYFLRVPPTMNTAREAVAWTFGLAGNDYQPHVQT